MISHAALVTGVVACAGLAEGAGQPESELSPRLLHTLPGWYSGLA